MTLATDLTYAIFNKLAHLMAWKKLIIINCTLLTFFSFFLSRRWRFRSSSSSCCFMIRSSRSCSVKLSGAGRFLRMSNRSRTCLHQENLQFIHITNINMCLWGMKSMAQTKMFAHKRSRVISSDFSRGFPYVYLLAYPFEKIYKKCTYIMKMFKASFLLTCLIKLPYPYYFCLLKSAKNFSYNFYRTLAFYYLYDLCRSFLLVDKVCYSSIIINDLK